MGVVPPFVAEPLNIAVVPAHILFALVAILTEGVTALFTVIVIGAEVAVGNAAQLAFVVKTSVIWSPFAKVAFV